MGNHHSSTFDFSQYGLTDHEVKNLHHAFDKHAGTFSHKLDHHEFKKMYLELNPEEKGGLFRGGLWDEHKTVKKAFEAADTSRDGKISFDEFAAFYLMHKSTPSNINNNMKTFIRQANGGSNTITPAQADRYSRYAHNFFDNPGDVALADFSQYGDEIPIDNFVDEASNNYYHHINSFHEQKQHHHQHHHHHDE